MAEAVRILIRKPASVPSSLSAVIRRTIRETLNTLPRTKTRSLKRRSLLHVSIVGSAEMRKLNRQYRRKDKPTDVLSFSRLEGMPMPVPEIGDLVLCWPVVKKQAKEQGVSLRNEITRLTAHGTLHLFGYDHERGARDARVMFRLQEKIVTRVSPR